MFSLGSRPENWEAGERLEPQGGDEDKKQGHHENVVEAPQTVPWKKTSYPFKSLPLLSYRNLKLQCVDWGLMSHSNTSGEVEGKGFLFF